MHASLAQISLVQMSFAGLVSHHYVKKQRIFHKMGNVFLHVHKELIHLQIQKRVLNIPMDVLGKDKYFHVLLTAVLCVTHLHELKTAIPTAPLTSAIRVLKSRLNQESVVPAQLTLNLHQMEDIALITLILYPYVLEEKYTALIRKLVLSAKTILERIEITCCVLLMHVMITKLSIRMVFVKLAQVILCLMQIKGSVLL